MKHCRKSNDTIGTDLLEMSDFAKKVMTGVNISFNKLVQQRSLEDSTLYFSDEQGHVVKVAARSIPKRNINY